ncbi:hypothetical protein HZA42_04625 [Candidatus Peregrinibacteria bacterium]|nr:hypothetical protein [Candidatus Peregrinibacteria bacterium]
MKTHHHPKELMASILVGVLAVGLISYTASASTTVGTDISTGGTLTHLHHLAPEAGIGLAF